MSATPLYATVLVPAYGESTNEGMSSRCDQLTVFKLGTTREEIDAYYKRFEKRAKNLDALKMRAAVIVSNAPFHPIVVPAYKELFEEEKRRKNPAEYEGGGHWCAGGNFCEGDSRWKEWTGGCDFPLSIHDRYESWAMYNALSI